MGSRDVDCYGGRAVYVLWRNPSPVSPDCPTRQSKGHRSATIGERQARYAAAPDGRGNIATPGNHRAATEGRRASLLAGRGLPQPGQARSGNRSLPGSATLEARLRRGRGRLGLSLSGQGDEAGSGSGVQEGRGIGLHRRVVCYSKFPAGTFVVSITYRWIASFESG